MKKAKAKSRKVRRVVLGVGNPWLGGGGWICLTPGHQKWPPIAIDFKDLGNWNKVRLVAEVLK